MDRLHSNIVTEEHRLHTYERSKYHEIIIIIKKPFETEFLWRSRCISYINQSTNTIQYNSKAVVDKRVCTAVQQRGLRPLLEAV